MLSFAKKWFLNAKQARINKVSPAVNIILHAEMPISSMNKMVEAARVVAQVNALEPRMEKLSDQELRDLSGVLRAKILQKNLEVEPEIAQLRESLEAVSIPEEKEAVKEKIKIARNVIFREVLPEAFALVREASRRVTGMRHFDTQIAGGLMLHEGRISEMATGEGKTLVATLPAYLNALLGRGVHVVTVNDYLARRDREWMGPIYEFLGLTVGAIQHEMSDDQRRMAYACDITYGTNNEYGFDYLRDNMKYSSDELVQRPFFYAIVDEVDSILVDEARTPLIISGPAEESTEKYYIIDKMVPKLKGRMILEKDQIDAKYKGIDLSKGYDYIVDEKAHAAYLTDEGELKACSLLGIDNLHDIETMEWRHHVIQGLRAHNLYKKDVDYVVKEGQVIIVDEFTGRMMPGRRWSDGLHQAVEAKEGMKIERENQTLATITFQNYFRIYEKLAGMTGTAFTEANEFKSIYRLDVVVIPTNKPLIRANYPDSVYKTEKEKFDAVVNEIAELHKKGTPILVGTISIDKSEYLSELLKRRGIPHQVLNAKYHESEAQIVAQAGRFKSVTIATNMAGRGTDILLGGNAEFMAKNVIRQQMKPDEPGFQEEYHKLLDKFRKETQKEHNQVVEAGGLHVLGTERHEARRIDNQLRGRSGRQGDPGASRFYVSLKDELMRLFGSERIAGLMDRLGFEEGQVIEHPWVSKSIEIAQRRVEQHNFEIRKQLLEYDNVMNKQREVIYGMRRAKLEGQSSQEEILQSADRIISSMMEQYRLDQEAGEEGAIEALCTSVKLSFGADIDPGNLQGKSIPEQEQLIAGAVRELYKHKEEEVGPELTRHMESMIYLQVIDSKWKDHLYAMDSLREGIGLRAYGQRDPLIEYKREAFNMFSQMIQAIESQAMEIIFKLQAQKTAERFRGVFETDNQVLLHPQAQRLEQPENAPVENQPQSAPGPRPVVSQGVKVGRNDPCPCGALDPETGHPVKYKKCHGK